MMLVWTKKEIWGLKREILCTFAAHTLLSCYICCINRNLGFKGLFLADIGQNKEKNIKFKKSIEKRREMKNKSSKIVSKGNLEEMICEDMENIMLNETEKKIKCEFNLKTPKGTKDWDGVDIVIREKMFSKIMKIFKRHGGIAIDTPVFELREILAGKYGEDSKLIYDLQYQGGELCSLRYDLTVPFARYLAMNPTIQYIKRYHIAKVYRRDQPAMLKGRMREFYQCDFDIAGCYDPMLPDTEILKILIEILEELNISDYVIKLNHRKILDGIFDVSGVPNDKFRTISSAVDKLDKLSWDFIKKEMVEEKGLDDLVADKVGDYIKNKGGKDLLEKLKLDKLIGKHPIALEGIEDMETLYEYLEYLDIDSKVLFDLSLARGLDYYTGLIYEAVLKPCDSFYPNSLKSKSSFNKDQDDFASIGSIAAGGRYDNLVGMFSSKKNGIPCVGVSIGVERIFSILKSRSSGGIIKSNNTEVYVMEFGTGSKSNMIKERLQICKELWSSGINAQFFYKVRPKPRQQFEAAEKDNVPIAIIFGQDEIANNQIRIKILGLGDHSNKGELVQRKDMEIKRQNKPLGFSLHKKLNKCSHNIVDNVKDIKRKIVYEGIRKKGVGVDDLTLLSVVKDEFINDNLKKRFQNKEIYTYIGNVLISVNPFQDLGIYTNEVLQSYRGKNRLEEKPHVYAIAESAFYNMVAYKENQCIIISGESGAGKTEAAKHIMQYISHISSGNSQIEEIKNVVLATNPLLESFGCAKTLRNDNSSRHGKYLEIFFNSRSEPIGANITNYLLEKSRVISQIKDERNFHIFYQLTKSVNQYYREENYGIQGPDAYFYTSVSDCLNVDGMDDSFNFFETCRAMETIGLSLDDKNNIFRMLAIILWLGNVQFQEDQDGNAVISDNSVTEFIAYLMNVDSESLNKALTTRVLETQRGGRRGSVYDVPLNPLQANSTKDALAKSIYNNLFEWILKEINLSMKAREDVSYTIGILDIYGFEVFENNNFEQICINYVNEKLQQIFVELTLKAEQEEYVREKIKWTPINYFNNKIVCDLIEEKYPPGIFAALNDTVATVHADSVAADNSFIQKLSLLVSNPHFEHRKNQFIIKHYAGDVIYTARGMTEKNKDSMLKDLFNLIIKSGDLFLHELFPEKVNMNSKKRPFTSVDKIKESANSLVNSLMKCQPSYIRTIKPNSIKSPVEYDEKEVLHQIKYLGLQENIRIRRAGFAYRQTFNKFVERFYLLSRKCSYAGKYIWKDSFYLACEQIFKDVSIPVSEYQMGITKVFIKHPETIFCLESMRDKYWHNMAIRIQSAWRNYLKYRNECAIKIQRAWRRNKDTLYYIQLRNQGHQILGGRKERRKASLLYSRRFIGDYMDINFNENFGKMYRNVFDINDTKNVEFSCVIELLSPKFGRSSKQKPRELIMTNNMIYIFSTIIINKQFNVLLERSIKLTEIRHVALSCLSDDWVCIKLNSKNESDLFFSCVFKTEFVTRLKLILHNLVLQIGPSIEYNKKPGKTSIVKFIIDPKIPVNNIYRSGVVYVLPGEPSNSLSKRFLKTKVTSHQSARVNNGMKTSSIPMKCLVSDINFSKKKYTCFLSADTPSSLPVNYIKPYYIALYDFEGQNSNEMSFRKNEILDIIHKENNGWWLARKNGVEGWVPENYLKEEKPKPQIPLASMRSSLAMDGKNNDFPSDIQRLRISKPDMSKFKQTCESVNYIPSIPARPSKLKYSVGEKGYASAFLDEVSVMLQERTNSQRRKTQQMTKVKPLYTRQELIGRGSYGAVYKGIHNETKQVVAIKVLNLDTTEDDVTDIQREISMLSQLRQVDAQNVVRYHGSFLYDTRLWVIMDFCEGGSIRTLMKSCRIEERYLSVIIRETLIALNYIHRAGIIHRDIKAANILVTNDGRVQLCDFGVAAQLSANSFKRSTFVGTPYWMAPEVITEGVSYSFKADIWSLGITVYEIATGNPPFADQEPMRAIILIPRSPPTRLEGSQFSSQLKEFVAICLNEDADERPSAVELLKTKFIKQAMKTPTSILRELLIRYDLWCQHGGVRNSINIPVNDENNSDDNFELDNIDDHFSGEWAFDTIQSFPENKISDSDDKKSSNRLERVYNAETLKNKLSASNSNLTNIKADHPLLQLFVQESPEKTELDSLISSTCLNDSSKNSTQTHDLKNNFNQISIDISNVNSESSLIRSIQNGDLKSSEQSNLNSTQFKNHDQNQLSETASSFSYPKYIQSNSVFNVNCQPHMHSVSPLRSNSELSKPFYSYDYMFDSIPFKESSSSKHMGVPLNVQLFSKMSHKNKQVLSKEQLNVSNNIFKHNLDKKTVLLNTKSSVQNISPKSKYSEMNNLIFLPPSPSQSSVSRNCQTFLKDPSLCNTWKHPQLEPLNLKVLSDYTSSGENNLNDSIITELEKVLFGFQSYLEVLDKGLSIIQKNMFIGGLVGYIRARSIPSLVAGTVLGTIYGCSNILIRNNIIGGYELSLFSSLLLSGSSIVRLRKVGIKFVPIVLGTVGILATGYYSKKVFF
ncbi:hypothetical protein PMAC_002244 [Pneumocystis sp. 'macacae']|nr:hypothetical protein PMAC_002244 [Pneumocystis sp. 'macacae']